MQISLPLIITTEAYNEIEKIIKEKEIANLYHLRIGMKGSSCGASHIIGFDTKADLDEEFDYKNIKILINKKQLMFLAGLEINFEEGENGQGFTFTDLSRKKQMDDLN